MPERTKGTSWRPRWPALLATLVALVAVPAFAFVRASVEVGEER